MVINGYERAAKCNGAATGYPACQQIICMVCRVLTLTGSKRLSLMPNNCRGLAKLEYIVGDQEKYLVGLCLLSKNRHRSRTAVFVFLSRIAMSSITKAIMDI